MTIYVPLAGPNDKGVSPKACIAPGWNMPDYPGIRIGEHEWIGMRLDDWIVVDCDDEDAKEAWLQHIDRDLEHTYVRKTPHGYHFFYRRMYDALGVRPHKPVYISPKIDLKAGVGHQVVYLAPGYADITTPLAAMAFDPSWVKDPEQAHWSGDEWSELPSGVGDNCMTAFAGVMRRWGMDRETIEKCLSAINEIIMTVDPMPGKSIRRIARSIGSKPPEEGRTTVCASCGAESEIR